MLQVLKEYEKRKKEKCNEKMKAEDETDQHKQEDKEMCSHLSVHSKEEAWTSDVGELPSSLRKRLVNSSIFQLVHGQLVVL